MYFSRALKICCVLSRQVWSSLHHLERIQRSTQVKAFAGAVPWDPWMQSRTTNKDPVENIIKCDLMYWWKAIPLVFYGCCTWISFNRPSRWPVKILTWECVSRITHIALSLVPAGCGAVQISQLTMKLVSLCVNYVSSIFDLVFQLDDHYFHSYTECPLKLTW